MLNGVNISQFNYSNTLGNKESGSARVTVLIIFALLVIVAAIVFTKVTQIKTLIASGEQAFEPPSTVSSIHVEPYEWESTLTAIGSLEATKGLVLTADLSGRITKIHFDAGTEVESGDLLVEQDTSVEQAQLRSADSAVALAKNNFERTRQLLKRKVASKSEFDNANSAYKSALADADNIRAAIEKKSMRAPFSGRLGIRLVNLGQSIDAGQPVVSLQATDQMFVNFFLPQQDLPKLAKDLVIRLKTDAVPNKVFEGTINAINPEIDVDTRSVEIQAVLDNPQSELLPGMFASIEVVQPETHPVLLIPITAVKYSTYGDSVFVIEPKAVEASTSTEKPLSTAADGVTPVSVEDTQGTDVSTSTDADILANNKTQAGNEPQALIARQQFVRLGETRGDFVVVTKGLDAGQEVVSMGVFKLRNGGPIVINNSVVPEYSLSPELQDK